MYFEVSRFSGFIRIKFNKNRKIELSIKKSRFEFVAGWLKIFLKSRKKRIIIPTDTLFYDFYEISNNCQKKVQKLFDFFANEYGILDILENLELFIF